MFSSDSPRGGGVLPIIAYTGRLLPKGVLFSRFRYTERVGISRVEVYERVGISRVEVYERVGKSVI